MAYGSTLSSESAFNQLQDQLYGSMSGYVHMSAELETGGRQIAVYHPGKRDIVSFQAQWDQTAGRFIVSGMPIHPSMHSLHKTEGAFGAMEKFVQQVHAGFDPRLIEGMETELDPFVHQRRQIGRGGPMTGGQALAAWASKQQTSRFMGGHPEASEPFSDVEYALRAPEQVGAPYTIYSTSGIMRRPFEHQFGALGSDAEGLRTIPGYGFDKGIITVPYKDQKDRERMATIGPGVTPLIHGGVQTNPFLRGDLPGAEERQALLMRTELVPGLITPGAGQSFYKTDQFQGVQLGYHKDATIKTDYHRMRRYMEHTGGPAASATTGLGLPSGAGSQGGEFGSFLGQQLDLGVRGARSYIPGIEALRLPYGEGLYSLLEQVDPKTLSQMKGFTIDEPGIGGRVTERSVDFLMQRPTTTQEISSYEQLLSHFDILNKGRWRADIGGGMAVEPFAGSANAQPHVYYGGQAMLPMQSGTALYIPGIKTAALGMKTLTGMGAAEDTQMLLAGESVKGMPYLISGLAQTLPRKILDPYLGPRANEMFDKQGNLIYGGEFAPMINRAGMNILTDLRDDPRKQAQFAEAGVIYRQGWFTPDVQRSDAMQAMRAAGTLGPQHLGIGEEEVGMWRNDPKTGRFQQYLESLSMLHAVTPFETFRGGGAAQSLTELYRVKQWAPGQYQSLLEGGQETRANYMAAVMASVNAIPGGASPLDVSGGASLPIDRARELAAIGQPHIADALLSGKEPVPTQYMLEAMEKSPTFGGRFMLSGGGVVPPAESLLETIGFGPGGYPVPGAVGGGIQKLLEAIESGEGVPAAGAQYHAALREKVAGSPEMWKQALGSESEESTYGRAIYLGAGPAEAGQFGVVLPDSMRHEGYSTDDLAKLLRAPYETHPGTVHALGEVMFASDYAEWQKTQPGLDQIDVSHMTKGMVAYYGAGLALADQLKVDIDKDLLGAIIMRAGKIQNPDYADLFTAGVLQSQSMYPPGDPRHKSVDAASSAGQGLVPLFAGKPGTTMLPSEQREQRAVDAVMKQRVGTTHNLLQLLNYEIDQNPNIDQFTKNKMLAAIGTIGKNQYIDQEKALRAEGGARETSRLGMGLQLPMNVRGFMGEDALPGKMSAPVYGHRMVKGEVRSESITRIFPSDIFKRFVGGAFEVMSDASPGYATAFAVGALGGSVSPEGDISNLPDEIARYIRAIEGGASRGEAEEALATMKDLPGWFWDTPIGTMSKGHMVASAFGAAAVTEEREDAGEIVDLWQKNRSDKTLDTLKDRPDLVEFMNKYLLAEAAMQASSGRGAIRQKGRGGFAKIDSPEALMKLLTQVATGEGGGVYGDVLRDMGLADLQYIDQGFQPLEQSRDRVLQDLREWESAKAGRPGAGSRQRTGGEETERWYRATYYDSSKGSYASTKPGDALTRIGDARASGRIGTIDWADVPVGLGRQARDAAVIDNREGRGGRTEGRDPEEGFFEGIDVNWRSESEHPGGAIPGSVKASRSAGASGIPGEPGLNKLSKSELDQNQRQTEQMISDMKARGETPVFDEWGRLVRSVSSALGGTGKGGGGTMAVKVEGQAGGGDQFRYAKPYVTKGPDDWNILGNIMGTMLIPGSISGQSPEQVRESAVSWQQHGGTEIMSFHQLMEAAQDIRHGAPAGKAVGQRSLKLADKMRRHAPAAADRMIMDLERVGLRSLDTSVRADAMAAALAGGLPDIGPSDYDMRRANVSPGNIRTIDQAIVAQNKIDIAGGYGTVAQKGQLMGALKALGDDPAAQDQITRLEDYVSDTQWKNLPKGARAEFERTSGRIASGSVEKPDLSGSLHDATQALGKFTEGIKEGEKMLNLKIKADKANMDLLRMKGTGYRQTLGADMDMTEGTVMGWAPYQEMLKNQISKQGFAEANYGAALAAGEMPEANVFGQIRADIGARLAPGKKAMTFYDLMYMKRVGQIFTGGMQQAGQDVAAMDTAMGQQLYASGAIGMPGQSAAEQARISQLNVQAAKGRAYNQVWGATMESGALGGIMPQAQAIGGPMAANALLASYFLPGVPAAPAIAAGITGVAGMISMGIGAKEEGGMMSAGAKLASDRAGRNKMGLGDYFALGAGVVASSGPEGGVQAYDAQVEHEARVQDVMALRGYSKDALSSVSSAQALTAITQRAQNIKFRGISRGMKIDDETANRVAVQMTQMAPGGMTEAQEDKWADAAMMGLDPGGMASQMYQATTGMMVTGSTDVEALAMQLTNPQLSDQAARFMGEGGASIQNQLLRLGGAGIDWQAYNLSPQEAERWLTVESAAEGLASQGIIKAGDVEGLVTSVVDVDPRGRTAGQRVAKEYTPDEGIRAGATAGFVSQMYSGRRGQLVEAMAEPYGGIGLAYQDEAFQAEAFQYQTGGAAYQSQVAIDEKMPWLATHDPTTGYKNFQIAASGFGIGTDQMRSLFQQKGITGAAASAFLGDTQVSAITGEAIGGFTGMEYQAQQSQYDRAMAGLGIQSAQLALRRQYTTGEGMPGGRGFWQIEDDMTSLSREQATYGWQTAGRRMEMQKAQFTETFGANVEQFGARTSWTRDDQAVKGMQMARNQQWAREDWAVSDNVRNMQWGWQNEDFEENVRFASGRDRRLMVREQERATTMHNVEGEQIDTQRERQEEMWALEEEQFEKNKARFEETVVWQEAKFEREMRYFEESTALSEEQHEKEMEFMKKRWALEDEMRAMQREFQKKQMDLSQAALGLQYQALEEQKKQQAIQNIINEITMASMAAADGVLVKWKEAIAIINGWEPPASSGQGWQPPSTEGMTNEEIDMWERNDQAGFSGLVSSPTRFTVAEGSSGVGGAAEYVSVSRIGSGGIPEAMGQRDGGSVNVTVILDGEEIASHVMVERGNNLRVEAYR